jgi:arginyl-tRNA synthetase
MTMITARSVLARALSAAVESIAPGRAGGTVELERPRQAAHGDYACSIALQLARSLRRPPREIAARLVSAIADLPELEKAEVAGAGFINLFLRPEFKQRVINRILAKDARYGRSALGEGRKVQVEFVSANPTGPLHVGHGRGAAYGASLANVLAAAGWEVTREYYVNDAGRQMDILAVSTWLRYLQLAGVAAPFPPNAYQGDGLRTASRPGWWRARRVAMTTRRSSIG